MPGFSLIVKRQGKTLFQSTAPGLRPLALLFFNQKPLLRDSDVFDKIVGEAAARLFILGKVKSVEATVASKPALARLEKAGVEARATEAVPFILCKDKTGSCGMELLSQKHPLDAEFLDALSKVFENR